MSKTNQNIMVKKDFPAIVAEDWMIANPWLWLGLGFVFAAWSWLWTFTYGDEASDYRVIVLCIGLLCAAVGTWMRWSNRHSLSLDAWRQPLTLVLGGLFAVIGLGTTILFFASFFQTDYDLKSAPLFLVWISTAPLCFFAARRCLNREAGQPLERNLEEETGVAFAALAAICLVGSFTLFIADDPADWNSMRMFLRVATALNLYASALTVVSVGVRRLTLSLLILLHFAAINTAALSAPPAPWIVQQTWMRFFRPYLHFVYLNNAYHFYAPEPGPASYVWFRIIYVSPDGQTEDGKWFKIPDLDEQGRIQHPVALDYQRFLSLTEAIAWPGPLPPEKELNPKTQRWEDNPFYARRWQLAMQRDFGERPGEVLRIPFHPALPVYQQVTVPSDTSQRLIASYARFVAHKFENHPDRAKADWKLKSVKLYRVVHWIPPVQWFLNNIPPTDPELYRPYYLGNYSKDGDLIDDKDPYLYWLLPSIRDAQNDPDSQIRDYARLHAGDRFWIRRGSDRKWVETGDADK